MILTLLLLLSLQKPAIKDSLLVDWRPDAAIAYDSVPTIYNQWWQEVQDCADVMNLKLETISWFVVTPSPKDLGFTCPVVVSCDGWWKAAGHEIFILRSEVMNEIVIKHEMLHEILYDVNIDRRRMTHHKLFKKCGLI